MLNDHAPFNRRPVCLSQRACLLLISLGIAACSPTFNWREVRTEGAALQALMPCKPETAVRQVPLLGVATPLHMQSCEAGGLTFAVAWAEVAQPTQVSAALQQWQAAGLAAIRADTSQADNTLPSWTVGVRGADQQRVTSQARGQTHDQRSVQMRAVYFAQGQRLYQAAVYGNSLPAAETSTFFEALRLP